MKITKELLNSYLKGLCTREECLFIEKYITEYPEVVDQLLPEEEWQATDASEDYSNSGDVRNKIFERIYAEQNRAYLKRKQLIAAITIAASFLIGISIFLF